MSGKKQILFHKKNSKGLSVGALAFHGSSKGGRSVAGADVKLSRAQVFLQGLKREIKKAV